MPKSIFNLYPQRNNKKNHRQGKSFVQLYNRLLYNWTLIQKHDQCVLHKLTKLDFIKARIGQTSNFSINQSDKN